LSAENFNIRQFEIKAKACLKFVAAILFIIALILTLNTDNFNTGYYGSYLLENGYGFLLEKNFIDIILVILLPILLYFSGVSSFFGLFKIFRKSVAKKLASRHIIISAVLAVIIAILLIASFYISFYILYQIIDLHNHSTTSIENLVFEVKYIYRPLIISLSVTLVWLLFLQYRHVKSIGMMFYVCGVLLSSLEIKFVLSTGIVNLPTAQHRSILPFAVGIILCIATNLLILLINHLRRMKSKRVRV
jgi:hypothetical protein